MPRTKSTEPKAEEPKETEQPKELDLLCKGLTGRPSCALYDDGKCWKLSLVRRDQPDLPLEFCGMYLSSEPESTTDAGDEPDDNTAQE